MTLEQDKRGRLCGQIVTILAKTVSVMCLLISTSSLCLASDKWCSSATATIGLGDSEPGGTPFGKRFVQFFDISTALTPSEQANKEKLDTINVTFVMTIVRTETDALNHTKDYEETIQFRVRGIRFGNFESRVRQDFDQKTTAIKRTYQKNITCDYSGY